MVVLLASVAAFQSVLNIMRVRQRGCNGNVWCRCIPYLNFTIDMNMHYIFKKERPSKVRDVLKRIGAIRW